MTSSDSPSAPMRLRALAWSVGATADTARLLRAWRTRRRWMCSLGEVYEAMPCGVVVLNDRGEVVTSNDAARRLLGLTEQRARGRFIARALPGALLRADGSPLPVEEYPGIRTLRTGQPAPATTVGLVDGAARRWLRVEAAPLPGPRGSIGAVITLLSGARQPANAREPYHGQQESAA